MNYWLLTNLFVFIITGEIIFWNVGKEEKTDFVELLPDQTWYLSPGEKKTVSIVFEINEGYHIQANEPLDDNLIPTELTIYPQNEFNVLEPKFPAPGSFHLKDESATMLVFSGELEIQIPVFVTDKINQTYYLIKGKLKYQACNSVKCYFPRELFFDVPVEIK